MNSGEKAHVIRWACNRSRSTSYVGFSGIIHGIQNPKRFMTCWPLCFNLAYHSTQQLMSTSNRAICPLSWFPLCHALRLSVRSSGRPASSMKTTGHRRDSWRTQLFCLWPTWKIQVCWWISWFCLLGWVKLERPTIFTSGEFNHPQSWFNGSLMGGSWWYTIFYHVLGG